jgi:hypothetical protein
MIDPISCSMMGSPLLPTDENGRIDWVGFGVVALAFVLTAVAIASCFVLAALDHAGMLG